MASGGGGGGGRRVGDTAVAIRSAPTLGPVASTAAHFPARLVSPTKARQHHHSFLDDGDDQHVVDQEQLRDAAKSKLLLWLLWNSCRTQPDGARHFMAIVAQLVQTGAPIAVVAVPSTE